MASSGGFAPGRDRLAPDPPRVADDTGARRPPRWRKAGVWDRLLDAVSKAYDGDIQMIDSSSIRVHQHAANTQKKMTGPVAWVARGAA